MQAAAKKLATDEATEIADILAYFQMTLEELMHHFKIDEFLVTLGANGGFALRHGGEIVHYDAVPIKTPVDPTGAGDVFFSAYITSRFADGKNIPDACRHAARMAAHQVAGKYISLDGLNLE